MDRTERFYKIELLLRGRGCVSFAALRDELDVSPATLKRDLQYLRDRLGAPIVYDAFENGYRFSGTPERDATGIGGPRHELPGLWFSENEIHALLTMHQLLAGLDDDGVLARHLQPLMDKLHGMLGADESEARALMQRRRLHLRYFKRSDRRESEREVSPQRLINYRNTWYLDAWCHASDGLRRFALDAVRDAALLGTKAKHVPIRELEAQLDAGYGIYGGGDAKVKWATLVFAADAAQWVANEEWHPQQQSRWLDGTPGEGRYELRVPYADPTELVMDILRHGDSVHVVADKALAATLARRLHSAAALYAG